MPNYYVGPVVVGNGTAGSECQIVVHVPLSTLLTGNNSAGEPWAATAANTRISLTGTWFPFPNAASTYNGIGATTILSTGTGPFQISTADAANILTGAIFEVVTSMPITQTGNATALAAQVLAWAQSIQTLVVAQLQALLTYSGYSA